MLAPLIRHYSAALGPKYLRLFTNLYAPFVGAGIRITQLDVNFRYIRVEMPLTKFNTNYVGTHFGGSLYAMTDPFFMLLLMQNLGPDYIVWDKAAKIEFIKPGRKRVFAEFRFSEEEIEDVRRQVFTAGKHVFDREVEIFDTDGVLIARVIKTLYVRKKDLASKG